MFRERGERAAEKPRITHEGLSRIAMETIRRDGMHVPMMFFDGSNQTLPIALTSLSDVPQEKSRQAALLGKTAANYKSLGELRQIVFISEGWVSLHQDAQTAKQTYIRPSQDPNRKEVLSISSQDAKTRENDVTIFEMIRVGKAHLDFRNITAELLGDNPSQAELKNYLLDTVLDSFLEAKKPRKWFR